MHNIEKCPSCNSSFDGGSILETFIKQRDEAKPGGFRYGWTDEEVEKDMKECYSPPYKWRREIGIEIQGHYDGVSYWKCPDCGYTWDRFTGKEVKL